MLIAYFSWDDSSYSKDGLKVGFTHHVADEIARVTGAQEFEIKPERLYPDDYDTTKEIILKEQADDARPKIRGPLPSIAQGSTVFLGYPNWCGEAPMAVRTFLDETDHLNGKTIIPFCTYGGSGWANTLETIKQLCPGATFREGLAIQSDKVIDSMPEIDKWVEGLGYGFDKQSVDE